MFNHLLSPSKGLFEYNSHKNQGLFTRSERNEKNQHVKHYVRSELLGYHLLIQTFLESDPTMITDHIQLVFVRENKSRTRSIKR